MADFVHWSDFKAVVDELERAKQQCRILRQENAALDLKARGLAARLVRFRIPHLKRRSTRRSTGQIWIVHN